MAPRVPRKNDLLFIKYYINSPFAAKLAASMTGGMTWLIVLGLFMGVSYIANKLALSRGSEQMQYLGLGLFVIAEAIVFLPLLFIATHFGGAGLIPTAGLMTLLLVGGITATVFITKKDFSFMGGILTVGAFVALGFIACDESECNKCSNGKDSSHKGKIFLRYKNCRGYSSN